MILDTNVVLYHVQDRLEEPLGFGTYAVSVITEMEVLSYPGLSADEDAALRAMFAQDLPVIGLTDEIKVRAIEVRKAYRLRLPDAIIVATALEFDRDLMTHDTTLTRVPGLRVRDVQPKPM